MRKNAFTTSAVGVFVVGCLALAQAQTPTITTLAGGGPNNLPVTFSSLGTPWSLVQDGGGNTYISDNLSNRIFKVAANGTLTVLAGNIFPSYRGDGQSGTLASLNSPESVALDSAGNVYIADTANNAIRVINTQPSGSLSFYGGQLTVKPGDIATVAGGNPGYETTSVPAVGAELNLPGGVWLDQAGNIYIADTNNSVIEAVNTQGTTQTIAGVSIAAGYLARIAGNNVSAFGGDGGSALSASINRPAGIFLDSNGYIYIADTNNSRIRVVNPTSLAITVAGVAIPALGINTVAGSTVCMTSTALCGDGGAATQAMLNGPSGMLTDSSGNIYIADTNDERIREVLNGTTVLNSTISTIAGSGTQCFYNVEPCGDGGPATSADLWAPTGLALESGNVLIADQNDDAIRTVVPGGNISTTMGVLLDTAFSGDASQGPPVIEGLAADAELHGPQGVVSDSSGNVYITDTGNIAIRKVTTSGIISTAVGCLVAPCGDNVLANSAHLYAPAQTALDAAGNLYIVEAGNNGNDIRVVNNQPHAITFYPSPFTLPVAPGDILTIVGTTACTTLPCGDGGSAVNAQLNQPEGLFVDKSGNIYIADTGDNAIRVVNMQSTGITVAGVSIAAGDIATVAGTLDISPTGDCTTPTLPCGDGGPATSATLNLPTGVALDSAGNIYIADAGDNRIRVVNASTGVISAFAGTGQACTTGCGDGGSALAAFLDIPQGLFVDYAGNVFIADTGDFSIREVSGGIINAVVDKLENPGFYGDGGPAIDAELTNPSGVAADPFGNLFIADTRNWRVRTVPGVVVTAPLAGLSPSSVTFPGQGLNTKSAPIPVTLSNKGNRTNLTVTSVAISGANAADFGQTNNCTSVPGGGSCTINVTITPSASGARSAVLKVTDNSSGSPQSVSLFGTGTGPSADLSPSPVTFPAQALKTKSAAIPVTLSNTGNGAILTVTSVAISGADKADFAQTNNCTSVPGPGDCTINVTITPSAAGARSAVLMVTDNAAGSPQSINLSGMGEDFALPSTGTLSTSSVAAGGSATATVTITPGAGLAATVDLTCAVTPAAAVPPTCSLSPSSLTPGTTKSTLTVATVAASSALFRPNVLRRSAPMYAIWLLLPGMLLSTAGMGASRRRKLISYFCIFCAIAGCLFLVACGGGSSSSGGSGSSTAGTTAGSYTITVTAKTSNTTANQTFPLTVQ